MEGIAPQATVQGRYPRAGPGLTLTEDRIEDFLAALLSQGRTPATIATYRRCLTRLYDLLPEDKQLRQGTLAAVRDELLEGGYSHSAVNTFLAAAEGLLDYCGRRDLQICRRLKRDVGVQPELTRNEYLRLLSAARLLDKERPYLLVKVFGAMGLPLRALPKLTVEAVREGRIALDRTLRSIPDCLREELLDYAARMGVCSGPVFVTASERPIERGCVNREIQSLGPDAQVSEEKCNTRCLRKLYQSTVAGIMDNVSLLAEQAHARLLDTEQLTIGWAQREVGKA